MSMSIRKMEERDLVDCLELMAEFYQEFLTCYSNAPNVLTLRKNFYHYLSSSFVVEEHEKVIGMFIGEIIKEKINDELVYIEILWYMRKDRRKYGVHLFKYVEEWARQQRFASIVLCHLGNQRIEKLFDFYTRLGYDVLETHYIKHLRHD